MGRYEIKSPDSPATAEQIMYALKLGVPEKLLPRNITKGKISAVIDCVLDTKPATHKQIGYALELGLEVPEGILFREISVMIDDQLDLLTTAALRMNPLLRVGQVISYGWWPFMIARIDRRTKSYRTKLEPLVMGAAADYHDLTVSLYELAQCGAPTDDEIAKAKAAAKTR